MSQIGILKKVLTVQLSCSSSLNDTTEVVAEIVAQVENEHFDFWLGQFMLGLTILVTHLWMLWWFEIPN